jgi:hypothetical protein
MLTSSNNTTQLLSFHHNHKTKARVFDPVQQFIPILMSF